MIEFERKVGPKGQVVIPNELRRITGIRPRSKVLVGLRDNEIVVRPEKTQRLSKWLEKQVKKDGKDLSKIDLEIIYEEELVEEWKEVVQGRT